MPLKYGACATGHPACTQAAAEILEDGGNAVDAAIAAAATTCVAEPALASLGGGGFALVHRPGGQPVLHDFFPMTPSRDHRSNDVDIRTIDAEFGTATQPFHIGLGTAAVPGTTRGLFSLHQDLGAVPIRRVLEPAIRAAREGVITTPQQAYINRVIGAILLATPGSRSVFAGAADGSELPEAGSRFRWPDLADLLDALAHEDDRLMYEGEVGRAIAAMCADRGGWITEDDLIDYRVVRRTPLRIGYRGWSVLSNPAPAVGGALVALTLSLFETRLASDWSVTSLETLQHMGRALAVAGDIAEHTADEILAAWQPDALTAHRARLAAGAPVVARGTTQISVVDRHGTAVAMTLSNGEGCGIMGPGGGFMLNNIMGEPDLCRDGPDVFPAKTRLASMMAPTLASDRNGRLLVCGSGGSRRIRSAIPQVISHVVDEGLPLDIAVEAGRMHWQDGELHVEGDGDPRLVDCAESLSRAPHVWPERSMFFGGVNAVLTNGVAGMAAADSRRGGSGWVK
ncbi:MAG: gamma-glutamyltransferase [Rhodospirillaceae bacterium]|nr:gamma-glutamyltransferase [Rhodospirillaceae bacterium]